MAENTPIRTVEQDGREAGSGGLSDHDGSALTQGETPQTFTDHSPGSLIRFPGSIALPLHTPSSLLNSHSEPYTPVSHTTPKRVYRNGYAVKPQTPFNKAYPTPTRSRKKITPLFEPSSPKRLRTSGTTYALPALPIPSTEWNVRAVSASFIPPDGSLRHFQVDSSNHVISREGDLCVIAPTGSGKSLLWCLLHLAVARAISLVITPYTALGCEGEARARALGLRSVFIHGEQKATGLLAQVAAGFYQVVFVCAEMLESKAFSDILHSPTFQASLAGLFLDEAHLLHESHSWRAPYSRLGLLRRVVGMHIPFIAISATLPAMYRASLCYYAGLKPDFGLLNLGNYRPELSVVVIHLQYEMSSFQDLAFVLPLGVRLEHIPKTIIYCDDTDMLTKMFWWFHTRLAAMNLAPWLVDILHAGLSDRHEEISLQDFRSGKTSILLATEKIGAGVDFPGVQRVVQFLTRNNLTLAKFDQRRGRGARTPGTTAVGYLLCEPDLAESNDQNKLDGTVDAGLLELVRTQGCYQTVLDRWLENPPRPYTQPTDILCCSYCSPQLKPSREYRWVMEQVGMGGETSISTPMSQREVLYKEMCRLRLEKWRTEWRIKYPGLGPKVFVADEDLERLAKVAPSITSVDDLRPLVKAPYWSVVAPWLIEVAQHAASESSVAAAVSTGEHGRSVAAEVVTTTSGPSRPKPTRHDGGGGRKRKQTEQLLGPGQHVLDFK